VKGLSKIGVPGAAAHAGIEIKARPNKGIRNLTNLFILNPPGFAI
jgi:hypothetical protein